MATSETSQLNQNGIKFIFREYFSTTIFVVILLLSAGSFWWLNAWLYTSLVLIYQIINILILYRTNPQLLNKRGRVFQENTKFFDRLFVMIYLPLAYTIPVIAGLDAVRFRWSDIPYSLNLIGGVIFVIACGLGVWAMSANSHFEMTVFIEQETQQICSSGPYKIIRHPGYAAEIIAILCTPLVLGSWYSFIPSVALSSLFVVRTALEDRTLQQELSGYTTYAKQTKYRLIPFIW
ncbi:MAG: methyltransferase family protein [Candidatus Helarchaeota archaeon]